MGLYDVAAAAQGGRCFYNLGRRLQIEEARAATVVRYLMRALRPSLVSWLGRPGGGVLLLQSLGGDGFEALLNETAGFTDGRMRDRGYRLVSQWMASAPLDMVALEQATLASGLGRESLMRILPWIAALQMGALQRAADKPMRSILVRTRGKRYAEHVTSPYAALLAALAETESNRTIGGLDRRLDNLVGRLTGSSGQSSPARA